MKYEPFAELLKPYWGLPLSGVPAALSERTIAKGVYDLWGGWDALEPGGRKSVAEGHDAMQDPARKGERECNYKLIQEMDRCLGKITLWEKMHPQNISEAGAKEAKLATYAAELAALQQQLIAPYSAIPALMTEPDLSTPAIEPAAIDGTAIQTTMQEWSLKKPERFPGYRKPLYDFLKVAHSAGQPRPKARDVLDSWKSNLPHDVAEVTEKGLKYYDARGGTKSADLDSIRKTIDRMT